MRDKTILPGTPNWQRRKCSLAQGPEKYSWVKYTTKTTLAIEKKTWNEKYNRTILFPRCKSHKKLQVKYILIILDLINYSLEHITFTLIEIIKYYIARILENGII